MKFWLRSTCFLLLACTCLGAVRMKESTFPFQIDWCYFDKPRKFVKAKFKPPKRPYQEPVGRFFMHEEPPPDLFGFCKIARLFYETNEKYWDEHYCSDTQKAETAKVLYQSMKSKDLFHAQDSLAWVVIKDTFDQFPELINVPFSEDGSIPDHLSTRHYDGCLVNHGNVPLFQFVSSHIFVEFFKRYQLSINLGAKGADEEAILLKILDFFGKRQKRSVHKKLCEMIPILLRLRPELLNKSYWQYKHCSISEIVLCGRDCPTAIFKALEKSAYFVALRANPKREVELLKRYRKKIGFVKWLLPKLASGLRINMLLEFYEYARIANPELPLLVSRVIALSYEAKLWQIAKRIEKLQNASRSTIYALVKNACDKLETKKRAENFCAARFIDFTPHELWLICASLEPEGSPAWKEIETFHSWTLPNRGNQKRTLPNWLWVLLKIQKSKSSLGRIDCLVKFAS